jgi:hypothetical protein
MMDGVDGLDRGAGDMKKRMSVRSCKQTFRGAWRGAGSSGLFGSFRLFGSFSWETKQTR